MTRVLVAYGSMRGSTAEIAEWIGETLRGHGIDTEVKSADAVRDISAYDAVVLGGALYSARWQADARKFARRHASALRERDVWLFSSGPLDGSAGVREIPPVGQVAKIMIRVDAHEHRTFGGRLAADAEGFIASKVAERSSGDYREPELVREWAEKLAAELGVIQGP